MYLLIDFLGNLTGDSSKPSSFLCTVFPLMCRRR